MQSEFLHVALVFSISALVAAVIAWKATVAEAIGRLTGLAGNRQTFNRSLNLAVMVATAGSVFSAFLLLVNEKDQAVSADVRSTWVIGFVAALLVGTVIPFLSAKLSWFVHEHVIGWPAPQELMMELLAKRGQSEALLERICNGSENIKTCALVRSERGEIRLQLDDTKWVPLVGIYGTNAQSAFDRLKACCPSAVFEVVAE